MKKKSRIGIQMNISGCGWVRVGGWLKAAQPDIANVAGTHFLPSLWKKTSSLAAGLLR